MNGFRVAMHEWKQILRSRKMMISMVAIILVPLLYSYLYLWAFWDPYERLNQLPVAVVNQDEGALLNGDRVNIGQDLVKNMKDDPKLKWDFTTESTARQGLEDGKYYMMLQIPADFSKKAATAGDEKPVPAEILYVPNESKNLLASQLGERAMETLKAELQKEMTEQYTSALFNKMGDMGKGLSDAADGSKQLADGLLVVKDGSQQLADGATNLAAGAAKVGDGAKQLHTGIQSLQVGLKQAYAGGTQVTAGLDQLAAKGNQLSQSVKQISGGMQQTQQVVDGVTPKLTDLNNGMGQLNGISQDAASQWKALLAKHPEMMTDPEAQKLSQEITGISMTVPKMAEGTATISGYMTKLQPSVTQLSAGSTQLSSGIDQYVAGVGQAKAGAAKVADGNLQLYNGAQKLAEGSSALASGGDSLANGGAKLQSGAKDINGGTEQLTDGSQQLAEKLGNGSHDIQSGLINTDQKSKNMANPVQLTETKMHQVPNYGTGFSPYFISLALYVGALLMFIVLDVSQVAVTPKRATAWLFGKFGVYSVIGILQAVIVAFLLQEGLGLTVVNKPMFYLVSIMTSLTFVVLIQGLISVLGESGRFFAIVILMLQLTSSAGTFPLEMTPKFFTVLNPYLPMTYTVAGLKAAISNGDLSKIGFDLGILLLFFIGCVLITSLLSFRRHPGANSKETAKMESVTV